MGSNKVAKKTVELFYDVVSPYSWLGFEILCRHREKWKSMNLVLRPFFLGGIMVGAENKPPGFVQKKAAYMTKELMLLRNHFQVPLVFPENPFESIFSSGASLPAMRFLTALNDTLPDKVEDTSRALWMRVWSRGQAITQPENLAEAGKEAGLSDEVIQDLLQKMTSPEVKNKLKAATQEALEYGAFGAPTIVTTDDNNEKVMLFGSDRFHILADVLGEKYEGPLLEYNKCKL